MPTVAQLDVAIRANTAGLVTGMNRAVKATQRGASQISGALSNTPLGAAFGMGGGAALGFAAFNTATNQFHKALAMVGDEMQRIDSIAKQSRRTGMSPELLTALSEEAAIFGANAADVTKGMETFAQRMGEAKQGTGEAVAALGALNMNTKEFFNLSPDEQFYRVSNALRVMGDEQSKMNIANDLFGRSGRRTIEMLSQGEPVMRNWIDYYDRIGLNAGEAAGQVERFNDAVTRGVQGGRGTVSRALREVGTVFGGGGPGAEQEAGRLTGSIGTGVAMGGAFLGPVGAGLQVAMRELVDIMKQNNRDLAQINENTKPIKLTDANRVNYKPRETSQAPPQWVPVSGPRR